jgi:hypothetical protein
MSLKDDALVLQVGNDASDSDLNLVVLVNGCEVAQGTYGFPAKYWLLCLKVVQEKVHERIEQFGPVFGQK